MDHAEQSKRGLGCFISPGSEECWTSRQENPSFPTRSQFLVFWRRRWWCQPHLAIMCSLPKKKMKHKKLEHMPTTSILFTADEDHIRMFCCCLLDSIECINKDVTTQCPHWSSTALSTTALISWCHLLIEPAGDDSWEQSAECDFFRNRCINIEDAIEAVTHGQLCVPRRHMSVKQGNVHD